MNYKYCPIDRKELSRIKYEYLNIMQCEQCYGILLNQEKLNKFKRKQETNSEELKDLISETFVDDNLEKIKCPACKFTMQKQKSFQGNGIGQKGGVEEFMIDICPSCKAIWLDGGELHKIELNFQESKFGEMHGKNYVSYQKLNKEEKKEFIKTIAHSTPSKSNQFFGAIVQAMIDLCRNRRRY